MPRQGVPYPSREICSLKCQIDALQRQINELMKSVNGVEGNGQGNVSLISGDPAIVINNDASQNQIEIALDSSQLPAAAVSSVNGQTGAVDLDASDIPMTAGQATPTVHNSIAANAGSISQLQGDLTQEITDRGNADSALQSNINAVSAGLPAAAAAAVAADPTVAQLAVDVPNKLDKITSGSALKAYTHTGATQGEKSVIDGTDADSIAIRDANGRLQAADPASGATDKTLVTANWVSQTGNSAPNNLMHRTANETVSGLKLYDGELSVTGIDNVKMTANSNKTGWKKLYEWTSGTSNKEALICFLGGSWCTALFVITNYNNSAAIKTIYKQLQSGRADIGISKNSNGTITVWQYSSTSQGYARGSSKVLMEHDAWSPASFINVSTDNTIYTLDQANMTMTNEGGSVINLDVWESIA